MAAEPENKRTESELASLPSVKPFPVAVERLGEFGEKDRRGYPHKRVRLTKNDEASGTTTTTEQTKHLENTLLGAVFEATMGTNGYDDKTVALKTMDERCFEKVYVPETEERLYRQLNAHGQLVAAHENPDMELKVMQYLGGRHNLMPLIDYTRGKLADEERRYATLQYHDYGDLLDFIRERVQGPLREHVARHIFLQVLEGLLCLHSNGLCHLDVSMENVLLRGDIELPTAVLHDFGLAASAPLVKGYITSVARGLGKKRVQST
eukprot:gb/GECG01016438.1/.p1 GENE.gb/GECG01016438.1/~~gb/GECG01016438.1/.p1  ORF type:complete len:265 (+),score=32.17 gb/GECG01016438.1/:1-795(+)